VQGFADDVVILISGKFLSTICDLMQRALNYVQNWCGEIGLNVNADKTYMVLFTKRRNVEGFFAPRLFDTELILNNQVKYLGVTLDSKLNWKFHMDNRTRKASIAYWQCRKVIGKTWDLQPKVVYWIYTSVIRPMLTYAALVWWKRIHPTTVKEQFGHVQLITCLGMTGCMSTTLVVEKEARQVAYR
jgi:hypothetical protein